MILLIDNYDSFTWNLYQYFCELGADVLVKRNDALTLADIDALKPQKLSSHLAPVRQMKPGSPLTLFATMPGACRFLASASVIRQWRRHLAVKLCAPQRSCTAKPRRLHITVRAYFGASKSTYRDTLPFAGGGTWLITSVL